MSLFELTASILGVLSVWLLTKQNIWCWPTGILMVLMYIYIFYEAHLYSDMLLQVFFAVMQFYGWYYWLKGKSGEKTLQVNRLNKKEMGLWLATVLIFSFILGWIMKKFTNADLPFIDATTAIMSVVAQWLMTKKVIHNWILWIVADIIYVFMYFYKELYSTAVLYIIFLGLACWGYLEWKKSFEIRKVEA
jgi:nicotinamide mononucleotide transporter